ncbi:MAG: SDR family NAD(P)-dependent oxidoreductase [Hydrogenophaga sp.]|uniref:SDR family NAD(P)-dependent oxidoreductase n=1 Tax=Hydrogenophaga sp. TaxID=1904254 RepID=UPI00273454A8|nr:SDR family NAD(P)-dependent oxidoreductase [Hydrogenophaga sp.]MDP3627214.1 SDR family NAD(P)-dependent oxidoreductase [Hydrogenophaga sp.]
MTPSEFADRCIVITGGAGGIGFACAQHFLNAGASVHLIDIDHSRLDEARRSLQTHASRVTCSTSDLASHRACAQAISDSEKAPFALVHMAGVFEIDRLDPNDRSGWDRAIASNLTNAYEMALAFRAVRDTRTSSRVVFSTSRAFQRATPGRAAYSAAKGGIVGLTRAFSRDFAPDILVNAVSPGLIQTRMTEALLADHGEQRLAEIPLQRFGTPQDVANVVSFLCSEASSYVTGQMITVDGGVING